LFLKSIHLANFKNHAELHLVFDKKVNCLIGPNGIGKTNILDAIHYVCLTKSYFLATDQQNIRFGADYMRLDGVMDISDQNYLIACKLPLGKKKDFAVNDLSYRRMSDHVGLMPVVMIAPDDNQLIIGSSEERRKFLDNTISQVDREYLEHLLLYNKYLEQRNALLKSINTSGHRDEVLLDSYSDQLAHYGDSIYQKRKAALTELEPFFAHYHHIISLDRERVSFVYESLQGQESLAVLLRKNLAREIMMERTLSGPHRDDVGFMIGDNKLKRFGSQGQQKSFLIALKLAQYHFIKKYKSFSPLLLIDDIFDKIDKERSRQLIKLLAGEDFGQIFITDTDPTHISEELGSDEHLFEIFNLSSGSESDSAD
jgi:DNA replication and repair protein RecF